MLNLICAIPMRYRILLALAVSLVVSYFMTPPVKRFAESVGAIDEPNERRINTAPIPRMGGIAIFCGFMLSLLLFVNISDQVQGLILGSIIIALMGALDDIFDLKPVLKLAVQIIAALVCVYFGVRVNGVSNFMLGSGTIYISEGWSIALTVFWIVACTNATNLIDGLDGLAVGMSAISALTLMIVSLIVADRNVTVILACLFGACVGFYPYNRNPAKIFMGDVGSQLLGFVLSVTSLIGLFKMHAFVTMLISLLAMAVPLLDTCFAFFRRILRGQSPFHADRGHFHHRLLALGLTQRQAVMVLYGISAFMGVIAILITGDDPTQKIIGIAAAIIIASALVLYVFKLSPAVRSEHHSESGIIDDDVKIYEKGNTKK